MRIRTQFAIGLLLCAPAAASLAQDSSLVSMQAGIAIEVRSDSGHVQKTFFTRHDLARVGVAAAVTGGVMVYDKKIARWTEDLWSFAVRGGKC